MAASFLFVVIEKRCAWWSSGREFYQTPLITQYGQGIPMNINPAAGTGNHKGLIAGNSAHFVICLGLGAFHGQKAATFRKEGQAQGSKILKR
jgi:hypothetical protein